MVFQILIIAGMYIAIAVLFAVFFRSVQTDRKLQEVHLLVNSQLGKVLERVMQLTQTLDDAGVAVPTDPHRESNENAARNMGKQKQDTGDV